MNYWNHLCSAHNRSAHFLQAMLLFSVLKNHIQIQNSFKGKNILDKIIVINGC
jgi:hypothetical protein